MSSRREFIGRLVPATALMLLSQGAGAAAPLRLEESDPTATALGYRREASKVDPKKYPTFAANRICGNCQLYAGKPAEVWGPCGAFGGKLVSAKGWCAAWVKKA